MSTQITKLSLPNGMLVLLKEIHTAPIISNWIWYRVGSRDEVPGKTGISHWIEHMLFKGTPKFPAKVLDRAISREGGIWNAMTYLDWTTYFETMPADRIDLALNLEADRVENCLFEPAEVEAERTVIISERQGYENEPIFHLGEEIQAAAFRIHSYHHEVIGDLADLRAIQRDDLYQHYRTFYIPNNAVLGISGDFETDKMVNKITELFSPIPAEKIPKRSNRDEPPQNGLKQITIEGPGQTTYLQISHRTPQASHADFIAITVLDSLLTGPSNLNIFGGGISNKTSRLYQSLVERDLVVNVQGGLHATIDPYLHTIICIVHPEHNADEVIKVIDDEIHRLQDEPPPLDEVRRAVKQARALLAFGSESITNQAFWLGFSEMFADYSWFENCLDNLIKVTPEDIQRVAQNYFRSQDRISGVYIPTSIGEHQS